MNVSLLLEMFEIWLWMVVVMVGVKLLWMAASIVVHLLKRWGR